MGILGGVVLYAGDMLLYYHPERTDRLMNMAEGAEWRIRLSGIFALLSTWFYMFGLIPVYKAFEPAKPFVRNLVVGLFAAVLISYGVVHGAYTAIAISARIALENDLDMSENTLLAIMINNDIRLVVYPIFALLSGLFIYWVGRGKTLYPRYMVFFFPLLPFLLRGLVKNTLHGKWEILIWGGYLNLILVLFFTASIISLRKKI